MNGLRTLRKLCLSFGLGLLTSTSYGFIPEVSQVIRGQSLQWRNQAASVAKGQLVVGGERFGYELNWTGPENHTVVLGGLSRNLFRNENLGSIAVLHRKDKLCLLRVGTTVYQCGEWRAWAAVELSGDSELAAAALARDGLIHAKDQAFVESNAKQLPLVTDKRIRGQLVLSGDTPVAGFEIKGDRYFGDVVGEEHPLMHFDATFLAPLLMRFRDGEDLLTLRASTELKPDKRKGRNEAVLSQTLSLYSRTGLVAELTRKLAEPGTKPAQTKIPTIGQGASGTMQGLLESSTADGQALFRFLLLTH